MKKLKIVFMGTPSFGELILNHLIKKHQVIGVVCQPDKERDRKGEFVFSPIKKIALKNKLEILQPTNIKADYQKIIALKPDIIITCAYGQILPYGLLEYPKYGCINIHASLLPKYRGGAPIHYAVINGDLETGITIMEMAEKMDAGDIINQEKIKIANDDNVGIVYEKLRQLGKDLLAETLPKIIAGKIKNKKQIEADASYAPNISKAETLIDFNKSKKEIYNQIRGLNPFPVGYSFLFNKRVKIFESRLGDNRLINKINGEICNIYNDGLGVKCLDGEIIITEIQIEGRNKVLIKDFLNGVNKKELLGERFYAERRK